ncbi:hypothetical protein [Bradyrhizobium sp. LMTR 3]|uniref:hypothetical protein n=1 Tax=Bradyrhizobium sp. LMTR 3 TaxID=189873 RepID=UPI001FDA2BB6|nr:hypothetical protein [Bradyrhizobium sp. LMTR 3]
MANIGRNIEQCGWRASIPFKGRYFDAEKRPISQSSPRFDGDLESLTAKKI